MNWKRVITVGALLILIPSCAIEADSALRRRSLDARVGDALAAVAPGMTVEEAEAALTRLGVPHGREESTVIGMIRGRWGFEIVHRDVRIIASYDGSGRVTEVRTTEVFTGP